MTTMATDMQETKMYACTKQRKAMSVWMCRAPHEAAASAADIFGGFVKTML